MRELFIIISLFLSLVTCVPKQRSDIIPNHYFPISLNNEWHYVIAVPRDGDFFNRFVYGFHKNKNVEILQRIDTMYKKPGIDYSLSYRIEKYNGDSTWQVTLVTDSLNFYFGARNITWQKIKKDNILKVIEKRVNRFGMVQLELSPEEQKIVEALGGLPSEECIFIGFFGAKGKAVEGYKKVKFLGIEDSVVVPAGVFKKCLKFQEEITPFVKSQSDTTIRMHYPQGQSWQYISYFAPQVGLVKKQQINYAGKIVNELLLKSYKIN